MNNFDLIRIAGCSFIGFSVLNLGFEWFFATSNLKCAAFYRSWPLATKVDFISRLVSLAHAFIVLVFAYEAIFYSW
jgi:hypothetical protein